MKATAVIPAGGAGRRMGRRKQYLDLAGEPLLLHAIRPFLAHPRVDQVIVVLPADDVESPPTFLPAAVSVVAGGAERGDSVRAGLQVVSGSVDVILIHDAARPLVSREIIDRTLDAAADGRGALAAVPVADTLKRVGENGTVEGTIDRVGLWRAQTPQAFPRAMIVDAYERAAAEGVSATDDAALVERFGGRVVVVPGSARNIKVTTPDDLALAERLFAPAER